jgi:DNA-binding GntR family transcriptional regulator
LMMNVEIIAPTNPFTSDDTGKAPVHQNVYERLRAMILFGDLAPGQAVTIQGLTTDLGVGMTPVREALRRLIAEGALTHQGNRRVSVPILTAESVEELGFMRKTLESELTRRAASRMTPDQLSYLKSCDNDLNKAISQGDIGGYLTHNYRFHAYIYECADAAIITATVDQLWMRFGPSLRVVCGRFGTNSLPDKHIDLLNALAAGDIEGAAEAMVQDVDQGIHQVRAALQSD